MAIIMWDGDHRGNRYRIVREHPSACLALIKVEVMGRDATGAPRWEEGHRDLKPELILRAYDDMAALVRREETD